MPWKLVLFIVCLVLVTVFMGFNIENRCNISFGFTELTGVPVFVTIMASFLLGVVLVLPFTFIRKKNKKTVHDADKSVTGKKLFKKQPQSVSPQPDLIKKMPATGSGTESSGTKPAGSEPAK